MYLVMFFSVFLRCVCSGKFQVENCQAAHGSLETLFVDCNFVLVNGAGVNGVNVLNQYVPNVGVLTSQLSYM